MSNILLIDGDAELGGLLGVNFARFGLELDCALTLSARLAMLRQGGFDAAQEEWLRPVLRYPQRRRHYGCHAYSQGGVYRVVGLELEGDDYLPKPFEPRALVARLLTVLRLQRVPDDVHRLWCLKAWILTSTNAAYCTRVRWARKSQTSPAQNLSYLPC